MKTNWFAVVMLFFWIALAVLFSTSTVVGGGL